MIKAGNIYLLLIALVLFLSGCDKESKLSPTEDLGIVEMFSPDGECRSSCKSDAIMITGFGFVLIFVVLMS